MRAKALMLALGLLMPLHGAGEYCSLIINVSVKGASVDVPVSVVERSGREIKKRTKNGSASFCGLGFEAVTVRIGHAGCSQLVILDVPLSWGTTTELDSLLDLSRCFMEGPPVAACKFLFRIESPNGEPIVGARLTTERPAEESHTADSFGRILLNVAAGDEVLGRFSMAGYSEVSVKDRCTTGKTRTERRIVMVSK